MAFLNRADCISVSLCEQGSRLYLDTTLMKAHFVLDVGEILVCCVRYLRFLPDRGLAVVRDIPTLATSLLGFWGLPGSIIP